MPFIKINQSTTVHEKIMGMRMDYGLPVSAVQQLFYKLLLIRPTLPSSQGAGLSTCCFISLVPAIILSELLILLHRFVFHGNDSMTAIL
jgi:hypothetical protein